MNALRLALLQILVLLASLASAANTLYPYEPALRQTTCEFCFFPQPVAVFVRDDAGRPQVGAPVTFSTPSPANAFIPNAGLGPFTVLTDSSGVAVPPTPGFIGEFPGSFTVIATSSVAAGEIRFDLTIAGARATRIEISYANNLAAVVGTAYPQRYVARVFGADGEPVPNAAVLFVAPGEPGPSVTFEPGGNIGFGQASSLGYAVAPAMRANHFTGAGEILAAPFGSIANHVFFDFANSAAGVASIEALPGSTPQSTRVNAFFPQHIGAQVRDAAGNPVKDAAVKFTVFWQQPGGTGFFLTTPSSYDEIILFTGADGRAVVPARLMAVTAGQLDAIAVVPGVAQPLRYALTAVAGSPMRFDVVSGNHQRALTNSTYAQPWVIRAIGDDGLPVPYAAVYFFADPRDTLPTGLFAGRHSVYAMADENGIATSPAFTANGVVGSYFGSASGFFDGDKPNPWTFFFYENVSPVLSTALILAIQDNVPVGGTASWPYTGLVRNQLGQTVSNVPFTYQVDPTCGRFLGQQYFHGTTNAEGLATSPLLEAIAPRLDCLVALLVEGSENAVGVTVHTFAPESVVLTPSESALEFNLKSPQDRLLFVATSADGRPVFYPVSFAATVGPTGATASFADFLYPWNGTRATVSPNSRPGSYEILLQAGPIQLAIPVTHKMGRLH